MLRRNSKVENFLFSIEWIFFLSMECDFQTKKREKNKEKKTVYEFKTKQLI